MEEALPIEEIEQLPSSGSTDGRMRRRRTRGQAASVVGRLTRAISSSARWGRAERSKAGRRGLERVERREVAGGDRRRWRNRRWGGGDWSELSSMGAG
jgi:hypothetical protein